MISDMTNEHALNAATTRWINDLAAQGILTTDAEFNIRSWNHWLETHSGRAAEEMIGVNLFEAFPELISRRLDRYYRNALEGQVGILSQGLHGYLLPMPPTLEGISFKNMRQSVRIAPLVLENKVIGTITVIDDVTERVVREAELHEQIAALEALHDIARAILSLDLAECLQRVVKQTSMLTGAELTAVVLQEEGCLTLAASFGRDIAQVELQFAAPDNIAAQVVQSGQLLNVIDLVASPQILTLLPDHRCASAAPLVSEKGVIGALVIESSRPNAFSRADQGQLSRLATQAAIAIENARLYGSMRRNEELLSTMLRSIGEAVIAADSHGILTFINPVAQVLTGWTQEDAAGRPLETVFNIVDKDASPQSNEPEIDALHAGDAARSGSYLTLLTKDGTERLIDGNSAPIKDEAGKIIGVIFVFRDSTERRQIERTREDLLRREKFARAEAEKANHLKDEFLATVSHELRTPLNAILGWTRLIRDDTLGKESVERALETIERSAKLQNQLIEDLMDVSRIISGNLRLDIRLIDLRPIIQAALEVVRPAADIKDIEIQTDLNLEGRQVYGDPNRMQQVVWNLLSNAVKFTPRGGRVMVRLEGVSSQARITISDTGKGISSTFLPHVFERFSQADGSTQRAHTGLGLGLAIVRHLIELQGGTVHAESGGEGQGATFTIELPLGSSLKAAPAVRYDRTQIEAASILEHSARIDGLQILIVDDDPDAREVLTAVLRKNNAQVIAVASCSEALDRLRRSAEDRLPDIIVSDIEMPGEDGYSLIRRVRSLPSEKGGQIPAIAMTAYTRTEDRIRALAEGFQTHIPKPIEAIELITVIASLTERL
jgi:PAS domain S-box-containing protein